MPVTQNAVRVTTAVSLGKNAEMLQFLAYIIRLSIYRYRYWLDDKCINYIKDLNFQ